MQSIAASLHLPGYKRSQKIYKELSDVGFISNTSGDIREVGEKAVNNFKGNIKTTAAVTAGVGLSAGAAYAISKSPKVNGAIEKFVSQENLEKLADKLKVKDKFVSVQETAKELTGKLKETVKKMPKGAKIVAAAGLLTALFAGRVAERKAIKQDGKIEQKYQDKKRLEDII